MTNEISVAVLLFPLPASVWAVGDALAAAMPTVEAQRMTRWTARYLAVLVQVALLSIAGRFAVEGGAGTAIQNVLGILLYSGIALVWAGGLALGVTLLYQLAVFGKRKLKEKHLLADL